MSWFSKKKPVDPMVKKLVRGFMILAVSAGEETKHLSRQHPLCLYTGIKILEGQINGIERASNDEELREFEIDVLSRMMSGLPDNWAMADLFNCFVASYMSVYEQVPMADWAAQNQSRVSEAMPQGLAETLRDPAGPGAHLLDCIQPDLLQRVSNAFS